MPTPAEYRAWAEESLRWARDAMTESTRDAYIKFALVWLESAYRSERLSPQSKLQDEEPPRVEFGVAPSSAKHDEVFAAPGKRAAPTGHRRGYRRGLH
jgi:hypothetical protein